MSESSGAAVERPKHEPWQFGLKTAILITPAVAVWSAVLVNRRQSATLSSQIAYLRPLAPELVVEDPSQMALLKLETLGRHDNRWDLYLPAGNYRLCLATSAIDKEGFAPVAKSAPIAPGRHRLELKVARQAEARRITVASDGATLLEVVAPKEWDEDRGSSDISKGRIDPPWPADSPLILIRRRNHPPRIDGEPSSPSGPTEGILLWIEPAQPPKP
jgi:hypothetical protein